LTFSNRASLTRYAWLSIGAAIVTITLKGIAYWLTGSVGLLSDAIESVVNLVGAIIALTMLTIAAQPPDEEHLFGHSKAEYFASGSEGILILVAAVSIGAAAIDRLIHVHVIEQAGIGLAVSVAASLINFVVSRILLRAGRRHHSITLEADGRHLMTDVWTSVGVVGGIAAVALTGWQALDPLVALAVAGNIIRSGFQLVRRSVAGLMDSALPADEQQAILQVLDRYVPQGVQYHSLRTSQAASRRFVSFHVLTPGSWTVQKGHDLLIELEAGIHAVLPDTTVLTHLEPREDPASAPNPAVGH